MASQDPDDWEFPLSQLPEVPIPLSQPSTSRRRLRDEEEPSKRHVQPQLNSEFQQALEKFENLTAGYKSSCHCIRS